MIRGRNKLDIRYYNKQPKYRIGDCVVYPHRYDDGDSLTALYQSKVIECYGLMEHNDKDDVVAWFYATEETLRTQSDNLEEDDILYKL